MKSANLKLPDIKDLLAKVTKNLAWLFFIVFLILALLEILELNTSLQIFLSSNQTGPTVASKDKGVRINFDNYNTAVKKIQDGADFTPTDGITDNPFSNSH